MEDNKLAIAGAISNMRTFASVYRSRERHLEMLIQGNIIKTQETKVSAVKFKMRTLQSELDAEQKKLSEMVDGIPEERKWLEDNKAKFDSLECMLGDTATALAQKLQKLVKPQ